jgi:hypothetical protein
VGRAALLAALLASGPGTPLAETLTVVAPEGRGPGTDSLAAELGAGIDRALAGHPRYRRLNEEPVLPGEAAAVFGCLRFDVTCALRAGEAAGADVVLVAFVGRERGGDGIAAHLQLLDVRRATPRRTLARVLRADPDAPLPEDAVRAALHALPATLLADAEPGDDGAIVVTAAPGDDLRLDDRPLEAERVVVLAPGPHRLLARAPDGTLRGLAVPVAAGEIHLVDIDRLPARVPPAADATAPRRIGAWMTLGVGTATLLGAGYMAIELEREQSDYNRARSAGALNEHRERGEKFALAGNVLLGASAAAVAVSLWLFLAD